MGLFYCVFLSLCWLLRKYGEEWKKKVLHLEIEFVEFEPEDTKI